MVETRQRSSPCKTGSLRTLAVDIGGTDIKTIVAMEFAESFHPLANSNRSAVITITASRVPESMVFFLVSVVEDGVPSRAKARLYLQRNFLP